ncbi:MAG: HAD family hydrolase [Synechococcales cyanobacterium]
MPAGILFDFDGTLADSRPAIVATMRHTFAVHQHPVPGDDAIRHIIGYGLAKGFELLVPSLDAHAVALWVETYRQHYPQQDAITQLYPGAHKLLASLSARGIPLMLVSNKTQAALVPALERLGIAAFFDLVVGEMSGRPLKPDARLWDDHIRPQWPVGDPDQLLMVGDTPTDIRFGKNCGIPVCWVDFGYGHPDDCLPLAPEAMASDLPAVLDYVDQRRSVASIR